MIEDRVLRDAARDLLEANYAHLRTDLTPVGLADRLADGIGEGAADLLERAGEAAQDNRGALTALVGALLLWFARHPIVALFSKDEGSPADKDSSEGEGPR